MEKWGICMKFQLKDDYITLAQLLKACDIVSTGGEAKLFLAECNVWVNDQPENRRGKKIYKGDVVKTDHDTIEVE